MQLLPVMQPPGLLSFPQARATPTAPLNLLDNDKYLYSNNRDVTIVRLHPQCCEILPVLSPRLPAPAKPAKMGWGLFSLFSASPKTAEAPATPPPPPKNGGQEDISKETLQSFQLQLMLLEEQHREKLLKIRDMVDTPETPQGPRMLSSPPGTQSIQPQPSTEPLPEPSPQDQFRRSAKQLGLFFAGAGFLTASTLISRRAVARKMVDSIPKFYQPSHHGPRPPPRAQAEKGEDQLVAVEALGLATLNVFSFGVMLTGGLMFAFDISNLEDLRRKARRKLYGTNGAVDKAAEEEVEEWIAEVLSRRDRKEGEDDSKKKDN